MISRLILIMLALVVTLAAGWMTAIFIFRHPALVEFQQAAASQPMRIPVRGLGFVEMTDYAEGTD